MLGFDISRSSDINLEILRCFYYHNNKYVCAESYKKACFTKGKIKEKKNIIPYFLPLVNLHPVSVLAICLQTLGTFSFFPV